MHKAFGTWMAIGVIGVVGAKALVRAAGWDNWTMLIVTSACMIDLLYEAWTFVWHATPVAASARHKIEREKQAE